jgi:predicted membrane channel-forming protein YqfA (hemolysin III family)
MVIGGPRHGMLGSNVSAVSAMPRTRVVQGVVARSESANRILHRPDPIPRVFGYHEVFHVLVIAGSVVFGTVIWS